METTASPSRPAIPIQSENAAASLSISDVPVESQSHPFHLSGSSDAGEADFPVDDVIPQFTAGSGENRRKSYTYALNPWLLVVLVLAFASIVIIVGISVAVSSTDEGNAGDSLSADGGTGGDSSSTARPAFEGIVNYLSSEGISSPKDLATIGSPQNIAAHWLAEQDKAQVPVPTVSIGDPEDTSGYMFMTRYIMALNYVAFDGPNWIYPVNFLSQGHVCSWHGFSLSLQLDPDKIIPSKGGGLRCEDETGLRVPRVLDLGTYIPVKQNHPIS
jgi:hypothetical protein